MKMIGIITRMVIRPILNVLMPPVSCLRLRPLPNTDRGPLLGEGVDVGRALEGLALGHLAAPREGGALGARGVGRGHDVEAVVAPEARRDEPAGHVAALTLLAVG